MGNVKGITPLEKSFAGGILAKLVSM